MKMHVAGKWIETDKVIEVSNPYTREPVDTVPSAGPSEVEAALASAERGAKVMADLPAHRRAEILKATAGLIRERSEELARLLTQEVGKTIRESRAEVQRAATVMDLSAEESGRLYSETIPLDAAVGGEDKFGFTLRVPCGVVAAIVPFNFPLNLLTHKVGPALAGGNAVIAKPASDTPLTALKLTELLLAGGLPPEAIQTITGPGSSVGEQIVADSRVRKVSFTGSRAVAEGLTRRAGLKKLSLELGSNSPVAILADADLDLAARVLTTTGYANAGQVCISTQRVLVEKPVYEEFLERFRPSVEALVTGDPMEEATQVGPLIREKEAKRVEDWIRDAVDHGADLIVGGTRWAGIVSPAILGSVNPSLKISCDELFGPAVAVTPVEDLNEAIALANQTRYGLSAGVFTRDLDQAKQFMREVKSGNIHINWGTQWRVDMMPYGGLKDSGIGKEGPRYAVEEMTELKMVVVH